MTNWQWLSRRKWVIVLCFAFLFGLLNKDYTFHTTIISIDTQAAMKMNSILGLNSVFDQTLAWLNTRVGDVLIFACLALLFCFHAIRGGTYNEAVKRLSYWLWLGVLCLITYMLSCAAEGLICRDTPICSLQHFNNVQTKYGFILHSCPTSSFPSGHGLAYIFFAMMAWQRYYRMSLILWCLAIIMLGMRLSIGLHWLSDIMIGSLFMSTMLVALISDTALKNTYKWSERFVSYVLSMLYSWRVRLFWRY